MIPDERTCQYFITIAREKNISRAARSLYISQPTLSRFLTGLEKELGTPLFIRNNGILSPTPAGELFFQYITGLKGMESRFSNDLSSLLLPQKQTLRIGAGSITSPFLPEKVFPILHREYPDVELSLTEVSMSIFCPEWKRASWICPCWSLPEQIHFPTALSKSLPVPQDCS